MSEVGVVAEADAPREVGWQPSDAQERYHIHGWSDGYFRVDDRGRMVADVRRDGNAAIAISEVVGQLREDGVPFPVLIRFQDIIRGRVEQLNAAFEAARAEFQYDARYRGVYPIKVNQLHEVVEEILEAGRPFGIGLECGSKAELVATLPHLTDDDTLLIVNGYKDSVMMELILTGQQLGKQVIPVLEKFDEFERLLRLAAKRRIKPRFGVRVRLNTGGSGKWADSGGDLSKFGISIPELLRLLTRLEEDELDEAFVLLHFHLGSQVNDIQTLRKGIKEITQIYAQLVKREVPIRFLDVGGGLGVNYEADYTGGTSEGINYTLQEYANSVVAQVKEVCDSEAVAQPTLITESGRALTAHHSVLVVEVLGAYRKDEIPDGFEPADEDHAVVRQLFETLSWIREDRQLRPGALLEAYHDAAAKRQEAESLFGFGYLSIEQKALAEQLYWTICQSLNNRVRGANADWLPAELEALDEHLVDQYLCDFSVFQSILDHWSFGQRFPIVPIERLDEEPDRRAVLVDLTCDSDGKVRRYVSANDDKRFLDVHALRDGEPYLLGFFLMGAYQDIMGDMHNLFGRVAEVHVYADDHEAEGFYIEKLIPPTTVEEILALVQYFPKDLQKRMEGIMRGKVEDGTLRPRAAVRLLEEYGAAFRESTYFNTAADRRRDRSVR
jgi:arginine decarboxylase